MPATHAADAATRKITMRCPSCGRWNRIDARRASDRPKCGACGTPLELDHPVTLDDDSFDRVITGTDVPVLVDFYADWCGPCTVMAPAVNELARTTVGRALVAKLDTDASPTIARRYQIRGIPTSIVFRGGTEASRQTGAVSLSALNAMLH